MQLFFLNKNPFIYLNTYIYHLVHVCIHVCPSFTKQYWNHDTISKKKKKKKTHKKKMKAISALYFSFFAATLEELRDSTIAGWIRGLPSGSWSIWTSWQFSSCVLKKNIGIYLTTLFWKCQSSLKLWAFLVPFWYIHTLWNRTKCPVNHRNYADKRWHYISYVSV